MVLVVQVAVVLVVQGVVVLVVLVVVVQVVVVLVVQLEVVVLVVEVEAVVLVVQAEAVVPVLLSLLSSSHKRPPSPFLWMSIRLLRAQDLSRRLESFLRVPSLPSTFLVDGAIKWIEGDNVSHQFINSKI